MDEAAMEAAMDDQQQDQTSPARQRRDFRNFQNLIDKLIGQARNEGQFDDLQGQGQPIDTNDDSLVPPEDRLGYRMLKSHGFAPPWMEARRDLETERARVEDWLRRTNVGWAQMHEAQRVAARVSYRRMLEELRSLILNYNLTTPAAAGQIEGIDLQAELARLGR
jgi:DnaJ family protein C protein 28